MKSHPPTLFRIDPLCEAFEEALQANERPQIEDWLEQAETGDRTLLLEHLLALELDYRQQAGENISPAGYHDRFPAYQSCVSRVLRNTFPQLLSTSPGDEALTDPSASSGARPPARLGDFELLQEIGRGGMGVVWQARQISLLRVVAIKTIMTTGFASDMQRQRFLSEAQAAATLDHPGIVPVYAVGEDQGLLYYSMGYVEGSNLAEFLGQRSLEPAAAAEMVAAIAQAVSHAHQRGIIHRDLKPANVLIGLDGKPRVTDFGLARRVDGDSGLTATGQILGTPAYMPPEQARAGGIDVTTRSDVYALGAILYQLLSGRPPFEADSTYDLLQQVIHREPVRPSHWNRSVPRDLETVCLKCLEKDPAQRYVSADELAGELLRFLDGEPVHARPVGRVARGWRWCRRNPLVASLLATTVSVLLTASVVSTWFAVLASERLETLTTVNQSLTAAEQAARSSAQSAEENADLARLESQIAMETLESMLYELQPQMVEQPHLQEIRQEILRIVSRTLQRVSRRHLSSERLSRGAAVTLLHLADTTSRVGTAEGAGGVSAAEPLYRQTISAFEELASDDPENMALLTNLATACQNFGDLLVESGRFAAALPMLQRSLALRTRILASDPQNAELLFLQAKSVLLLGEAESGLGNQESARIRLAESLEQMRAVVLREPENVAWLEHCGDSCMKLGDWYFDFSDDLDRVEALYREHLEWMKKTTVLKPDDLNLQMSLSTAWERLGNLHLKREQLPQARLAFEESLRLCLPILDVAPNDLQTQLDISISWEKIGRVSLAMNDHEQALTAWTRALELRLPLTEGNPTSSRHHRLVHLAYQSLAEIQLLLNQSAIAAGLYREDRQLLQSYQQRTGDRQFEPVLTSLENQIARLTVAGGEPQTAEHPADEAVLPAGSPQVAP